MTKQYYYHNNNCQALHPVQKSCICWHDQGTGPLPEKCWSPNSPDSHWRDKPLPMINFQSAEAFRSAKTLTALYTRLDMAREGITLAMDNLPKDFDINQTRRINELRNILSREMSNIWDLREAEERRLCEQPDSPTPPVPKEEQDELTVREQLAINWLFSPEAAQYKICEARAIIRSRFGPHVDEILAKRFTTVPDSHTPPEQPEPEWVTQDLLPDRPGTDQWRWVGKISGDEDNSPWYDSANGFGPFHKHGYIDPNDGERFEVRCRPEDLPAKSQIAASSETPDSPADSHPADDHTGLAMLNSDQISPPDPTFMQVDSPGLPITFLQLDQSRASNPPRVTAAKLPVGGLGGV